MSTDDTAGGGPSTGAKEQPGAPKRPTPTIELEAEDVTARETQHGASADADAPPSEAQASEEQDRAEGREEERVRAFRAPQRTGPDALRGFATHLAAELLGGVVGVLAIGYGLDRLPLTDFLPRDPAEAPATAAKVQELEGRISEAREIAEQARQQSATLGEMRERIASLEETLKSLGDTAQQGGGALAQATALASRITELGDKVDALQGAASASTALKSEMARLTADIDALRQRLDNQAAAPAVAPQLTGRLDEIGQRIGRLEEDVEQAGKAAEAGEQARAAALALAYANLERAIGSGRPYTTELEAVARLAPAGADLTTLKDRAAQGVPSVSDLQASFDAHARAAERADAPAATEGWLGRLLDNARSVVTVRRIAPEDGSATGAILARMGDRVRAGEIAGAVAQGEALRGAAREAMQPWLDEADARTTAISGLEALKTRLMAGAGPEAPPQAGR